MFTFTSYYLLEITLVRPINPATTPGHPSDHFNILNEIPNTNIDLRWLCSVLSISYGCGLPVNGLQILLAIVFYIMVQSLVVSPYWFKLLTTLQKVMENLPGPWNTTQTPYLNNFDSSSENTVPSLDPEISPSKPNSFSTNQNLNNSTAGTPISTQNPNGNSNSTEDEGITQIISVNSSVIPLWEVTYQGPIAVFYSNCAAKSSTYFTREPLFRIFNGFINQVYGHGPPNSCSNRSYSTKKYSSKNTEILNRDPNEIFEVLINDKIYRLSVAYIMGFLEG